MGLEDEQKNDSKKVQTETQRRAIVSRELEEEMGEIKNEVTFADVIEALFGNKGKKKKKKSDE